VVFDAPVLTIFDLNGRLPMSEPKDLLLVIEQLRRSNRRWKALALGACAALLLVAMLSVMAATRARIQAEAAMRAERDARVAALNAANAPNPAQPR
jgi:hypothetical protein